MSAGDFLLGGYGRMLETALNANYQFIGFDQIGRESGERSCLLRHDVDLELLGCGPMLEVEKRLGVCATYFIMTRSTMYNAFCVESVAMIRRILNDGHRLGLHFMGERMEGRSSDEIVSEIAREAQWLEGEFRAPVRAVSFHQPSQALLDGQLAVPGLVNTYNRAQLNAYFYVSDTNMTWKQEHPEDIFAHGLHPRLQLLVHPIWWTERQMSVIGKWHAVLRKNQEVIAEHLEARERSLQNVRLLGRMGDTV